MIIYCVGASFVGIAFQPLAWCFLGLYCSVFRWARAQKAASQLKFSAKPEIFGPVAKEAPA
jgi:hypothetical protein